MSGSESSEPATAASASRDVLFVIPSGRGQGLDGFRASIRGHLLELADPDSGHRLAPTPDDLLIASIASDFAWFTQRFLRARGIADYPTVSAGWLAHEDPRHLGDVEVTVALPKAAAPMTETLSAALESRFARSLRDALLNVRVRAEHEPSPVVVSGDPKAPATTQFSPHTPNTPGASSQAASRG
jgi:hypothetical protein